MKTKLVSMEEALGRIHDGDTVVVEGLCGACFAEDLAIALEKQFLETGRPRGLTLIHSSGIGDGKDRGLNHLAHPGLLRRVIGGHWGLAPKMAKLALDEAIEAYNLPQGVIAQMMRDIAAKKPRTLSRAGLGTFVDPRLGGGKLNSITKEDLVEVVSFDGQECLAFKPVPVNVALLRGTTADLDGNVTMEKEALVLGVLSIAQAVKNAGGRVIVEVERVAERGSLKPKDVRIPGVLVDCVVIGRPQNHWQTFGSPYDPALSGELRAPAQSLAAMVLDDRKLIARRAALELRPETVVNLGIGMPEGVASVAQEEGVLAEVCLTTEAGTFGGMPAGGLSFGASSNLDALVDQPAQFDFYDGGGLDVTVLGLAQADRFGNLNVSKFGPKLAGCGGFINISYSAKKVVFVGTFTAGGLEVSVADGRLRILKEGIVAKFVEQVEQITFSGKMAHARGQPVLYVTERCVFKLGRDGLELIEVAPGIDVQKDIIGRMGFKPAISSTLQPMDPRIFREAVMGLRRAWAWA